MKWVKICRNKYTELSFILKKFKRSVKCWTQYCKISLLTMTKEEFLHLTNFRTFEKKREYSSETDLKTPLIQFLSFLLQLYLKFPIHLFYCYCGRQPPLFSWIHSSGVPQDSVLSPTLSLFYSLMIWIKPLGLSISAVMIPLYTFSHLLRDHQSVRKLTFHAGMPHNAWPLISLRFLIGAEKT